MKMKPFDLNNEKYHIGHLVWDALRRCPDDICQIDAATGESETNASVLRRTLQFVKCLRRFGVRPGDVLALGGRNHLDLHIPFYAALMIGMPVSGVDPDFKYAEIKIHFKLSSPKIAFCQKEGLEDHLQVIKDLDLDTKLICFDDGEYSMKRFIQEYDDNSEDTEFEPLDFDLDQINGLLISTGGTTGVIKLAVIKHRTFVNKLFEMKIMLPSFPFHTSENAPSGVNLRALHLSPVQWISSTFGAVLFPAMRFTQVTSSAPSTPEHIVDIINKYKPVTVSIGPFAVSSILNSKTECDLSCFSKITITGAKIHKNVLLELRKRLSPSTEVSEVYGQTESLGLILLPNPSGPIGNCGYCPIEWKDKIKLVDPETGTEITEPNVPGEMWSKMIYFSGYYNNPQETANAITEDGWYKTGDLMYRDEERNYFFVERLKMLIKYRNEHVVPPKLEAVILEHPGVSKVSVTSIPHEEDGEHPVACVVRKNGSNVTAQEIKDLIASKLSDSQKLRGGVVFMDEIPLTSSGKIARGKLKQMVLTAHRE